MLTECLLGSVLYISLVLSAEDVSSEDSEDNIPCEKGWFFFNDKCYRLGGKKPTGRLSWERASERCKEDGGSLATIDSMELNDFLLTFLVFDAQDHAWIGLHDRESEGNYAWDDGTPFDFRNFEPGGPEGSDRENCFELLIISLRPGGQTGQWNDLACNQERAYICQTPKRRQAKKNPDPRFCAGGAWKHLSSCYSFISEKMSWENAEKHCQTKFGGHLVTISDFTVDMFLDYILSKFDKQIWIGIKIKEQVQQKWTSGWFVAYNDWPKDQNDFIDGTCTLRSKSRVWTNSPCSRKYPFVCETSSVSPPVLSSSTAGAKCPDLPSDWKDLGGDYCYYFDTTSAVNWNQANFECMRRGGSLLSLHSAAESAVIHPFVKFTQVKLYIGLYRLATHDDVFVWSDGSHLDFLNWHSGEPNNANEMCGELWTLIMSWNDVRCHDEKGYICSVRKRSANKTEITTNTDCPIASSLKVFIGVGVCILLLVVLLVVVIYRLKPCGGEERRKVSNATPHTPTPQRARYRSSEIIIKEEGDYYEHMA